jgi:hypothetical protein
MICQILPLLSYMIRQILPLLSYKSVVGNSSESPCFIGIAEDKEKSDALMVRFLP